MKAVLTAILTVLATAAQAQSSPQGADLPASISPASVMSVVTADWNGDGSMDRAVLVEGDDDDANLYIYLASTGSDGTERRDLALAKSGAAWRGLMWGTLPSLDTNQKGSLLLKSGNDAIGRSRWSQTLTITYRNKVFTIVGITFTSRDTLSPGAGGGCDLNLLSGQGIQNGKKIKIAAKPIPLADWSDESLPKECNS